MQRWGDYIKGEGVPVNKEKAAEFFISAATQGFAESQYILGIFYSISDDAPASLKEAHKLWALAAQRAIVVPEKECCQIQ